MKLGFMTFINPEWTLQEHVAAAKKYGYTGIEPRVEAGHAHGIDLDTPDAKLAEAKAMVEGEGLEFCCVATSSKFVAKDKAERAQVVARTKQYVELAAKIGAPCIRVFGGMLPEGVHLFHALDYMPESLRAVGEFAEAHPVDVCFETHDAWISSYRVMELMRRTDHPKVAVNYDYAHCGRELEPAYESFMHLRPWIRHAHMHDYVIDADGKTAFCKLGEGVAQQRDVMKLLLADRYKGYFSLEVMRQDAEPTLKHYAETYRAMLAEIS